MSRRGYLPTTRCGRAGSRLRAHSSASSSSFETDADYDKLRAWTYARFEPSWTGAYSYGSTIGGVELRYYPVFKSANNNIRHSLDVMSPVEEDSLNGTAAALAAAFESRASVGRREDVERGGFDKCKFTFIRDPLARFVSAYSEFEFRTSAKLKLHMGDSCPDPADWTMVAFDASNMVDRIAANVQADSWWPPLVGTTERAALALKLIASLRWVDQRAKRDVTQDPAPVRRAFNCLVAFHHFFPQSSNFVATAPYRVDASTEKTQTPLNFVGKLERFGEDWDKLADTCGVTPASALRYDPLPNGGVTRKHRITTRRRRCRGTWRETTTRWWRFVCCTSTITRGGIRTSEGVRRELHGDEPALTTGRRASVHRARATHHEANATEPVCG